MFVRAPCACVIPLAVTGKDGDAEARPSNPGQLEGGSEATGGGGGDSGGGATGRESA